MGTTAEVSTRTIRSCMATVVVFDATKTRLEMIESVALPSP
jgi:hypothetical protein